MPNPIGRPARKIDPRTLGGKIRRARKAAGLSSNQLGDLAKLSGSMVLKVERGETTPSLEFVHALARALGVPPRSLDERLGD